MKSSIIIVSVAAVCGWLAFAISNIHRQVSNERVKTRFSFQLNPGQNRVFIALPGGSYTCVFTDTPELEPSLTRAAAVGEPVHLRTTIFHLGGTLMTNAPDHWLKFQVRDDNYSPVEIQTLNESVGTNAVYLNMGGTF